MNKSSAIAGLTICILTTGILVLSPLFIGQISASEATHFSESNSSYYRIYEWIS